MATPTLVVLVVGAVVTVLLIGFALLVQVQRVLRAYQDITRLRARLQPSLDGIRAQQAVSQRELARVADVMDTLRNDRSGRSRR